MESRRLFALPLLCLVLALPAIGIAGCGGGGSDDSSSSNETTTSGSTTEPGEDTEATEPGEDSTAANAPAPSGNAVRSEKVEIDDFAYKPDPVRIEEGGKVIWVNEDSVAHTATAEDGSFDTGPIEEGKIKSETFKQPGVYKYVCSIHPQMHGTIEVVPAG